MAIISLTKSGNTFTEAMGADRDEPFDTSSFTLSMAFLIIVLSMVLDVMSNASIMGTPVDIRVLMVLANLAVEDLTVSLPNRGMVRANRPNIIFPVSDLLNICNATIIRITTPIIRYHRLVK